MFSPVWCQICQNSQKSSNKSTLFVLKCIRIAKNRAVSLPLSSIHLVKIVKIWASHSLFSGLKFMKIAKNRAISSLLSALKLIKIAKNQAVSSLLSGLKFADRFDCWYNVFCFTHPIFNNLLIFIPQDVLWNSIVLLLLLFFFLQCFLTNIFCTNYLYMS